MIQNAIAILINAIILYFIYCFAIQFFLLYKLPKANPSSLVPLPSNKALDPKNRNATPPQIHVQILQIEQTPPQLQPTVTTSQIGNITYYEVANPQLPPTSALPSFNSRHQFSPQNCNPETLYIYGFELNLQPFSQRYQYRYRNIVRGFVFQSNNQYRRHLSHLIRGHLSHSTLPQAELWAIATQIARLSGYIGSDQVRTFTRNVYASIRRSERTNTYRDYFDPTAAPQVFNERCRNLTTYTRF